MPAARRKKGHVVLDVLESSFFLVLFSQHLCPLWVQLLYKKGGAFFFVVFNTYVIFPSW